MIVFTMTPGRSAFALHFAAAEPYTNADTMQLATALPQGLSIVAFAWYAASALLSGSTRREFERYGLARLRVPIASLQIAGSVGLLAGHFFRPLLVLSASGFTVMMVLAVIVRLRIRDPLRAMLPALVLLCLNLYLATRAW